MHPPLSPPTPRARAVPRDELVGTWAIYLLVFTIPWGDMLTLYGDAPASRFVTLAVFLVWLLLARGRRRTRRPISTHYWALLFIVWVSIGSFVDISPERGLRRSLSYCQLLLDAWLIYQLVTTPERFRGILQAYVFGSYVVVAGVAYSFLNGIMLGDGRYTAAGYDPNDLAGTLTIGLPIACYLMLTGKRLRWLNGIYVPLAVVATLLTASRMGLVMLAVSMFFPMIVLPRISMLSKVSISVLLLLTGGVVVAFWNEISIDRLSTIGSQVRKRDLNGRVDAWNRGFNVFLEHPIVGVGGGGFADAIGAKGEFGTAAHNAFLEVMAENGIVGLALFGAVLATVLRRSRRTTSLERRLLLTLMAGWAVAAMVLSWENREITWLLFGICTVAPRRLPAWRSYARRPVAVPRRWNPEIPLSPRYNA